MGHPFFYFSSSVPLPLLYWLFHHLLCKINKGRRRGIQQWQKSPENFTAFKSLVSSFYKLWFCNVFELYSTIHWRSGISIELFGCKKSIEESQFLLLVLSVIIGFWYFFFVFIGKAHFLLCFFNSWKRPLFYFFLLRK